MFVSNDWHAALVPSYLAAKYRRHGVYQARALLAGLRSVRDPIVQKAPVVNPITRCWVFVSH